MSVMTSTETKAQHVASERLFQPYQLGPLMLPHRIVMAPLTRSRARQPGNVPTTLNACYYAQRVSAALIVSEATQVSMQGRVMHGRQESTVGSRSMAGDW
jgi:N-ethylmaleimide reductase